LDAFAEELGMEDERLRENERAIREIEGLERSRER